MKALQKSINNLKTIMMKKGIFIALLTVIICQSCYSKRNSRPIETDNHGTIEQLFTDFAGEKNAVHVKIGGFTMALTRVFTPAKGVSGVEVYSLDECSKEVKDKFNAAVKNLKDKSYETLVSTSENGERTKVLLKMKENYISEIVVIAGGHDPALIRIKGKIKPGDVKGIIDKNK
jgi:hypothetical protein